VLDMQEILIYKFPIFEGPRPRKTAKISTSKKLNKFVI
jgi:hypothetical protein